MNVLGPHLAVVVALNVRGLFRGAVATQIDHDDPEPLQRRRAVLLRPGEMALRKAMHEENLRAAGIAELVDRDLRAATARNHRRLLRFGAIVRSEEHTSELQSRENLVCRLLLEKKQP